MTDETPIYPAARWIRLTVVDGRELPAFAPAESADDPLAAYAASIYATERDAIKDRATDRREGFGGDDDIASCTIRHDGTIVLEDGREISRDEVYAAYFPGAVLSV